MNDPDGPVASDHWPEGLIRIHPTVQFTAPDPQTGEILKAVDWTIPGLWSFAKLESSDAKSAYWVDFPYSIGLLAPTYLNIQTGKASSGPTVQWYGERLQRAWAGRIDRPVHLRVKKFKETRKPVLLNCLYPWHGDAVSLLLRSKALHEHGLDVIVLIGPSLERLLPKYLAEAWIIEGKNDLEVWNEGLSRSVKQEVSRLAECYIPRSFKPAHVDPVDLAEVTGTTPFVRENWSETLLKGPVVTFISRDDRCWSEMENRFADKILRGPLRVFREMLDRRRDLRRIRNQQKRLEQLARQLQKISPHLEFTVCGLKSKHQFPANIKDLRFDRMNEEINRLWDEQCSRSHVVIGVHGSHTMPHNGFAGSFIELVPLDKWGNLLNTPFVTTRDERETLFCYRFLPLSTTPHELAPITLSLIYNYPSMRFAYRRDFPEPVSDSDYATIVQDQKKRMAAIVQCTDKLRDLLAP